MCYLFPKKNSDVTEFFLNLCHIANIIKSETIKNRLEKKMF
jgi:hypothetical protein